MQTYLSAQRISELVRYDLTVIDREAWGALPPKEAGLTMKYPLESVILAYNTGEPMCLYDRECRQTMRKMQKDHMDKGLSDIYYNYVVGGNGFLYEGRGMNIKPPKTANYPEEYGKLITIGVIGDGEYEAGSSSWRLTAPAMKLCSIAVQDFKILMEYNIDEDRNPILPCAGDEC